MKIHQRKQESGIDAATEEEPDGNVAKQMPSSWHACTIAVTLPVLPRPTSSGKTVRAWIGTIGEACGIPRSTMSMDPAASFLTPSIAWCGVKACSGIEETDSARSRINVGRLARRGENGANL